MPGGLPGVCDDSEAAPGAGVLRAFGLGGDSAQPAAAAGSDFDSCLVFQTNPPWTHHPENPLVTDPWPNLLMDCFNAAKLAGAYLSLADQHEPPRPPPSV